MIVIMNHLQIRIYLWLFRSTARFRDCIISRKIGNFNLNLAPWGGSFILTIMLKISDSGYSLLASVGDFILLRGTNSILRTFLGGTFRKSTLYVMFMRWVTGTQHKWTPMGGGPNCVKYQNPYEMSSQIRFLF